MATIPLTLGEQTLIDDEDLALVSGYKWSLRRDPRGNFYARAAVPGTGRQGKRTVLMHRVILGAKPGEQVDHRNGDGLDNRRSNLRLCAHRQNQFNQRKQRRWTSSQFKGVTLDKKRSQWAARIKANGSNIWLGRHDNELDAARAYNSAAMELFGEFANLNDVP